MAKLYGSEVPALLTLDAIRVVNSFRRNRLIKRPRSTLAC